MDNWRKDNFPSPQARLPLDAEDWSWRQERTSGGEVSNRGNRVAPGRQSPRLGSNEGESSRASSAKQKTARPVPRMPKTRPETQVRSRGITLAGTLLILGLTVLAFAGGRLFGRVEEPTAVAQVESPPPTVPAAVG